MFANNSQNSPSENWGKNFIYFLFVVVLRFSQARPGFEIQEQSFKFFRIINSMMVRISFFNACSSLISTHLLLVNFWSRKHAFIQEHFSSCHFEECRKFRLSGKFSLHSNSKLRYSLKNQGDILKSKFKWRFKKICVDGSLYICFSFD